MNASLDRLVCLLRDELLQHGELLALLERQQEYGRQCWIEDILPATEALEVQCQTLQHSQQQRSEWQAEVAGHAGLNRNTPLADLIPALPADYQPVLEAFITEIEEACERTLHRLRQNHQLLNRSLEVMVRLLYAFNPADSLRVDTDRLDCCIQGNKVDILSLEPQPRRRRNYVQDLIRGAENNMLPRTFPPVFRLASPRFPGTIVADVFNRIGERKISRGSQTSNAKIKVML